MADEDEITGSVCQELYRARLARVLGISSIGAVPVHAGDAPSRQPERFEGFRLGVVQWR
jgi:hypothetical protein